MRVLVTRPLDDAEDTAALLRARGHDPLIAPLLSVHYHDGHALHLEGVQAILATSANGVRAFARRTSRRDFPVFTVGSQTAQAARDAGFADVRNADGNAQTLAAAVRGWADPKAGALLHAAGAQAEGHIARVLETAGYVVRTEILYEVPAVTQFPPAARAAIAENRLDAVLLYSARSAQAFADCIAEAALQSNCARLAACCISEAAAKPLASLAFKTVCNPPLEGGSKFAKRISGRGPVPADPSPKNSSRPFAVALGPSNFSTLPQGEGVASAAPTARRCSSSCTAPTPRSSPGSRGRHACRTNSASSPSTFPVTA
jgi:uroporphyrinogen-III synthase